MWPQRHLSINAMQCEGMKLSFQSSCLFYYYHYWMWCGCCLPLLHHFSPSPSSWLLSQKCQKFQCIIIIKLIQKTWFVKRFASAIEKFNWLNNFGGGHHWCVKLPKHVFRRVGFYAYIYTQVCFFKNTYLLKYELNKLDNFKKYVSVI